MGFDFTVVAPLLPSHCGFSFVFGCGLSFFVSSSVFLSMIVQQLVVILVFSQEGVRARPSTLPSWFRFSEHGNFECLCVLKWFLHFIFSIGYAIVLYSPKVQWILSPNTQNQYFTF